MEPFPTGLILAGRSFCQDLCVVPTQPKLHFPKLTLAGSHNPLLWYDQGCTKHFIKRVQ